MLWVFFFKDSKKVAHCIDYIWLIVMENVREIFSRIFANLVSFLKQTEIYIFMKFM